MERPPTLLCPCIMPQSLSTLPHCLPPSKNFTHVSKFFFSFSPNDPATSVILILMDTTGYGKLSCKIENAQISPAKTDINGLIKTTGF